MGFVGRQLCFSRRKRLPVADEEFAWGGPAFFFLFVLRPQIARSGYWGGLQDWGKEWAKALPKDPVKDWDARVLWPVRCCGLIP